LKKIVSAIRRRMPKVKIVARVDSGFARVAILAWCEGQRDVFYLLGMARNRRLEQLASGATLRAAASFCLAGVAGRSWMAANQMRLWFSSLAYLLLERMRASGLEGS
jgi:hypothetical protein